MNGGIAIVRQRNQYFDRIQSKEKVTSIRALLPLNDSTFLVNSYVGQLLADKNTKKIDIIGNTIFPNEISKPFFGYDLIRDSKKRTWSTADNFQIVLLNTDSIQKIERHYDIIHPKQFVSLTRNLYFDSITDSLFVGTTNGLFSFSESLDSFLLYQHGHFADQLTNTTIHNIRAYGDSLWICTDIGLFLKTSNEGISEYIETAPYAVNDIHIDSKGYFWLATLKNGVLYWDLEKGLVDLFNTDNGLSNNNVTCIYPDTHGNLWIPTFYGLNYLDTKQFSIQSFFEESGIAHNEFNNGSHFLSADSLLYLGGINGVTIVDTKYGAYDFNVKNNIPFVASNIKLYDKRTQEIAHIEIQDSSPIEIPAIAKGLILDFDFLDFQRNKLIEFYYQIENLDSNWISKKNDQLELVVPPPGKYILRLKAKSNDGRWSSNEIVLPIIVQKPIYLNWWFLLLSLLGMIGISYGFIKLLLYQSRLEKNRLEKEVRKRTQEIERDKQIIAKQLQTIKEVQESKEKIFGIIGHDLRSPLSGLRNLTQKINYLVVNDRWEEIKILTQRFDKNIETVQQLLDQLLVWTQLEQGEYQIEPKIVDLTTLMSETVELYDPLIQKKAIQLSVKSQANAEVFADHRSLATIVRNLLDNAIKHTPAGGYIQINTQYCQFSIANQGEKMPINIINYLESSNEKINYPSKGLGLQICKELLSLNEGKIRIKSELPETTSIHVKFTYH